MKKGQAFLVVGHSNWGKSQTLVKLAGGLYRYVTIGNYSLFIKRMSNDDDPKSLYNFIKTVKPKRLKFIIIAFCPNFANPKSKTLTILRSLKKKYKLYFFVLKKCYKHDEQISPAELEALYNYGEVEVLNQRIQSSRRANLFKRFIGKKIKP